MGRLTQEQPKRSQGTQRGRKCVEGLEKSFVGSASADAFWWHRHSCLWWDRHSCLSFLLDHVRPREGQECPSTRPHITGRNAYATKRHASAEADPTQPYATNSFFLFSALSASSANSV